MSPPASGDARPTSRHAAGGRRAADRGSAGDSGRRSGDSSASSAPEVSDSGDDLGIAAWLDSAGPAPYETGPLLPGLGGLIDPGPADDGAGAGRPAPSGAERPASSGAGRPAPSGAGRPASKHAAPTGRAAESRTAADLGRPGDREADAGSGRSLTTPPATESRHTPDGDGEVRGSRRSRATGPTPSAGEPSAADGEVRGSRRSRATGPTPSAGEPGAADGEVRGSRTTGPTPAATEPGRPSEDGGGESRRSRAAGEADGSGQVRESGRSRATGPTPSAGDPGAADGGGEVRGSRRSRTNGPTPAATEPGRPSDAGGGESRRSSRAAEPGRSRTGEPDQARSAAEAGDQQTAGHHASKHAGGRRRRSGPVPTDDSPGAAAGAPVFGTPFWSGPSQDPDPDDPLGLGAPKATPAATPDTPQGRRSSRSTGSAGSAGSAGVATQAWAPLSPPETATRVAHRAPEVTSVATVAPLPTIHAFAPTLAPDPIDEDADAPERELSARGGGGGARGRSPSTRPRKTGDQPPPGRATAGALAACLAVAAVLGFAGGAWFGSRDEGTDPAGNARTSDPGAPGEGEAPPAEGLTLSADPVEVAPNDLIALAGTLAPVEDGVQVSLQHRVGDGEWVDYPASRPLTFTTRADGSFSGSVATDAPGPNFFRVVNVDDPEDASNEIEVTVAE